jgi:hypothetical protein
MAKVKNNVIEKKNLIVGGLIVVALILIALYFISYHTPQSLSSTSVTINQTPTCPATSYYNQSLGYCYWNASIYFNNSGGIRPACPPGAVYYNATNCKAEGDGTSAGDCVAGYVLDKQNSICEPLSVR